MKTSFPTPRLWLAAISAVLFIPASAGAATVAVTNTQDALAGSLRQAIQDASPGDTIIFQIPKTDSGYHAPADVFFISLTSGELAITKNLTIDGGGQRIFLQGNASNFRIFSTNAPNVTISGINILYGGTSPGGGGGILNSGTLTVRGCTLFNNNGLNDGGAVHNAAGGSLTVENCTLANNRLTTLSDGGGRGGGIYNKGTMVVRDSTIFGNEAMTMFGGGGDPAPNFGGGIYNSGTARIQNTIIAGNAANTGGPNVFNNFISDGYNLIGDSSGSTGFGATGDQVSASLSGVNLGLLVDNGGTTFTMRPKPGSLAIDQGKRGADSLGNPINLDQRGNLRPNDLANVANAIGGDGSDIGAVETSAIQVGPTFVVTTVSGHDDGVCSLDDCTFPEALKLSNATAGNNTINFAAGITGTTIVQQTLSITDSVTINGPGAQILAINAAGSTRLFVIAGSGSVVNISGLSLRQGRANSNTFPDNVGGAILNSASLTLTDCTLSGNSSTSAGGCIYNNGSGGNATLTLVRCTLSGNSATASGGGIVNAGYNGHATVNLTNCTLDQNSAPYGGAIYNDGTSSGNAVVTLTNCTLNKNSAGTLAGGIYNDALNPSSSGIATVLLRNTILGAGTSGNLYNDSAAGGGGSITSQGNNLSSDAAGGDATTGPAGFLNAAGDKRNTDPQLDILKNNGGPTDTVAVLSTSPAIDAGNDANAPGSDQRGFPRVAVSDIGAFEFGSSLPTPTPTPSSTPTPTPTATATATPGLVGNVSTRLPVGTGDDALIEGFIVQGPAGSNKKIMVRAIGPSLVPFGITDALANPILEIHDASSSTVATNDNWKNTQLGGLITGDQSAEIATSGAAPSNDLESAIIANLAPGSYTAVVRGVNNTIGTGVVDAYDLSGASPAQLANISTRGLIQPGDKLMIAGFIIQNGPVKAVIRAIGPSLSAFGITNALGDTTLQLRDVNGAVVRENDNWKTDQKAELESIGLQPTDDLEAALVETILPGQYTAQVRGKNDSTGIGVVQVYFLQ